MPSMGVGLICFYGSSSGACAGGIIFLIILSYLICNSDTEYASKQEENITHELILNENGKEKIRIFLKELAAKRKEILDAGKDTADETALPDEKDILCDAECFDFDDDGNYMNFFGCTDHYDSDKPICLNKYTDFEKAG